MKLSGMVLGVGIILTPALAHADQIARFGVRNAGSDKQAHYVLAGSSPNLVDLEIAPDGTAVAELATNMTFDPGSVSVRSEGDFKTTYKILGFPNNHTVAFMVPRLDTNDVVVMIISGNPPPMPGPKLTTVPTKK